MRKTTAEELPLDRPKDTMEDSLTSVYLTHLLLKLQIAELDYREAVEFAFNYSRSMKTCESFGADLVGAWSTVCRNGKALTVHFRDPEMLPVQVRFISTLYRRHVLFVILLDDDRGHETQLDLMSVERVEVPVLTPTDDGQSHEYSLAGVWPVS